MNFIISDKDIQEEKPKTEKSVVQKVKKKPVIFSSATPNNLFVLKNTSLHVRRQKRIFGNIAKLKSSHSNLSVRSKLNDGALKAKTSNQIILVKDEKKANPSPPSATSIPPPKVSEQSFLVSSSPIPQSSVASSSATPPPPLISSPSVNEIDVTFPLLAASVRHDSTLTNS